MEVRYHRRFLKDLANIPAKDRSRIENFAFTDIHTFNDISQIPNLEKLQGYTCFYRIRFGDYRVGIRWEHDILTFERVLHRKDIYKYFP